MLPVVFPDSNALWLFGLAALALLAIPGPAVLYIVTQSAEQGRKVGLASVAGVHLGTLAHVAAASAGLSALIVASPLAFDVVKYAGAAYLVYLGIRKLLARDPGGEVRTEPEPLRRAFWRMRSWAACRSPTWTATPSTPRWRSATGRSCATSR